MMYIKRPNHIGIQIGEVVGYNKNKGYTKIKLSKELNLGDSIAITDSSCKISELMIKNTNIKTGNRGQIVTIGRIYGDIKNGDKVFKTVDINLNKDYEQKNNKENTKRDINCRLILKKENNPLIEVEDVLTNIKISIKSNVVVQTADKTGLTKERIIEQLSKTGNTVFEFAKIDVEMDNNIIIPISALNELRRNSLELLEKKLLDTFKRGSNFIYKKSMQNYEQKNIKPEISLCLNNISEKIDYSEINNVDNIYIPIKFFFDSKLEKTINVICNKFNVYILFPNITKSNYSMLINKNIYNILSKNIKGVVISNLSQLEYVKDKKLELIANYTMNIANNYTIEELKTLGFNKIIILPELNKKTIQNLGDSLKKETIVYGRTLLMTSEYCMIGTYKNCIGSCKEGEYCLKDRLGFEFPVYTDRINCNNLIYNSKITSIKWNDLNINSIRIDILNENIEEINKIIKIHSNNEKIEGKDYTNGNLNKEDY